MRVEILIIMMFFLVSCDNRDKIVEKEKLYESDYRLFQQTKAWDLAKAVEVSDVDRIKNIVNSGIDVDFQESKYGNTLLMLSIKNEDYKSAKELLRLGADPNKSNFYNGSSAMIDAANFNTSILSNTKFLELLIAHGGDANYIEVGERKKGVNTRRTPLIVACGYVNNLTKSPIGKVEILVENGADVNYENEYGEFALQRALMFDHYDVTLCLLKNGADYNKIIFDQTKHSKRGKKVYICDILRDEHYPLDSKKHKQKMKIVAFLESVGVHYFDYPIPEDIVSYAKKNHPETWEEYLLKY